MTRSDAPRRRVTRVATLLVVIALLATGCGNRRPFEEALLEVDTGVASGAAGTGGAFGSRGAAGGSGTSSGAGAAGGPASPGAVDLGAAAGDGAAGGPADGPSGGGAATGEGTGGSPADLGPATYDQGASDTEIRFGAVSSLTGLFADFMQPRGARAYFKLINSQGGVNGRQLTLLIYDDQWDVTRNAALTRQAVESDKVFGFVAQSAPLSAHGGRAYIEENGLAVIGGDMIDAQSWGKSPNFYPVSYLESAAGGELAGRFAASLGCQRTAGMSLAVDESRGWTSAFERGLTGAGAPGFAYTADVSFAETDYTSYVATAKSRNVDCLTFGGQTTNYIRLQRALTQQNFDPTLVLPSSAYDPVYTKDGAPGNDGDYSMVQYDILENAGSNPAIAQFAQEAARWEPGMKQSGYALLSWVGAQVAVEALKRMGNTLTRENLINTLDQIQSFDTGIVPPISYSPGPHPGSNCGNVIRLQGGAWSVVQAGACL